MFTFHHTGCLVENIETSVSLYQKLFDFKDISEVFNISDQKVRVCFINTGHNTYLELVEPSVDNSVLWKMLYKKTSYYHIGYLVDNLEKALEKLKDNVHVVNTFYSEAFGNRLCSFIYTKELHLIELIQR